MILVATLLSGTKELGTVPQGTLVVEIVVENGALSSDVAVVVNEERGHKSLLFLATGLKTGIKPDTTWVRVVDGIRTVAPVGHGIPADVVERRTPQAPFYMVYLEGGGSPTKQHTTEASAAVEAERLAKSNKKNAYVLRPVGKAEVVTTIDYKEL